MRIAIGLFSTFALAALVLAPRGGPQPPAENAATGQPEALEPPPRPDWGTLPLPRFDGPRPQHGALAAWTLSTIRSWPRAAIPAADYEGIAESIAGAAEEDSNPCEAAALLASLGYFEGARFAEYVDNGDCNAWAHEAWRKGWFHRQKGQYVLANAAFEAHPLLHYGTCDSGLAYSIFQIHPFGDVTAEKLADRSYAARVALRLVRADASLAAYTGESLSLHPKAEQRRLFAEAVMRRHPHP